MIVQTEQDLLNFLEMFHIGTSSQLHKLFWPQTSLRYCNDRLLYHYKQQNLNRCRSTISNGYAYYINKKPVQVSHDLYRTEVFTAIKQRYEILDWSNEYTVNHIRPDARTNIVNQTMAFINDHETIFTVFIEIHLSNKFNFQKYIDFANSTNLKLKYGLPPRVLIVTDREVKIPNEALNIGFKFKVVGAEDMKGIDRIFF
jgi:hypothetical protein